MAGFGFNNSPAFSQNPQVAQQLPSNVAQSPHFGQQQFGQQQFGQQQQGQQYGQPIPTPEQLGSMYDRPAATPENTGRLTYDGVIMKTAVTLGLVAVGFGLQMGLFFVGLGNLVTPLMWVGVIGGLVLGLVNAFKRVPSPALVLLFGFAEGLMAGGFSLVMEFVLGLNGIIFQALLATACVFAATLALYAFRIVRVTPKLTRFFLIAMVGYAAFSLVNFGLMIFNVSDDPWGLRGSVEIFGIPLGVIIGLFAVLMGAYSLMLDFNNVETGVQRGVPAIYGWQAAYGLTATIVWIYIEILRILAILRGR